MRIITNSFAPKPRFGIQLLTIKITTLTIDPIWQLLVAEFDIHFNGFQASKGFDWENS